MFTIITASLNNGKSLKTNLASVQYQTFRNIDHIAIDGGSVDGSVDILKEYESKYNLRWLSEPDEGISDALNKGLKLAKSQYVLVLHADDHLISPDILRKVYPLLKSERYDIHSFPVVYDHSIRGKIPYRQIRFPGWYHFKTVLPHQGAFVHRRVYERIGGYRKIFKITLDYDFFYRAFQDGCSLKYENFPIAVMGGGGVSSRVDRQSLSERIREEYRVQKMNESSTLWKIVQFLFHNLYFPYKCKFIPRITNREKPIT